MKLQFKLTALVLALLLAVTLCACGSDQGESSGVYGTYKLYAMDYDESHIVLADDFFEGESYVELKLGGTAKMCLEGETADVKWKQEGAALVLTADDGDMAGTLSDGILAVDFDGTKLYFVKEGAKADSLHAQTLEAILNGEPLTSDTQAPATSDTQAPAPDTQAPAPTETEVQKLWNGWWYGCADINGSEKGWEWANGLTFDVAMKVELDAEGKGTLGIYDPYGEMATGPNNNRFITINCHGDLNYLYGDSGTEYGYDIDPANWRIVRNLSDPDKLNVGSSYTDADGNKMGYDFTFKRWGDRWEGDNYTQFIPHFGDYLAMLDKGWADPYNDGGGQESPAPSEKPTDTGDLSPLLGGSPTELNVNDRGIVSVYYPADQFVYDDWYGKLKNEATGVGILLDPMLGAANLAELKASYEANNSDEEDYSLVETQVNGYRALVLKYTDWLSSTMRVDIDFGGNHDGWYGISFAVSGNSLRDCDTDLIWAIIQSMKLMK